eukprot:CAMPEP_0201612722 /NCGR_PEP_ID=MMETSP0492-20130828/23909_1 /ASSEMBLY_ACC=CAM_ASM_000837 /TAXON_ID=420259 /ORGANISM="Thalassiosira gravida, Strain GMp14c1" /LENGTH=185 /DNA_ID=CAMNT_0048079335 /DNA_START=80 /DNA_END=637 /DNA_ORIENTATION=-
MMKSSLFLLLAAAPATAFMPIGTPTQSHTALSATTSDDEQSTRRTMLTTSFAALTALATPLTATALETYLTEPTEEFKESERQRMEFRKKQLGQKAQFVKLLARLTGESSTEEELVNDLVELRALVKETEGLPLGIKKEDMYKVIRSKKAKGFWPTNVEIAYQGMKSEVAYQQSPNRDKDMENPL